MKKIIIAVACCLVLGSNSFGAQPNSIGSVKAKKIVIEPLTLAQINALLPDATGQFVLCSDCTRSAICVSSGSHPTNSVGAWVVPVGTGTFVGSTYSAFPHCQ